jgi:hypothetical protein
MSILDHVKYANRPDAYKKPGQTKTVTKPAVKTKEPFKPAQTQTVDKKVVVPVSRRKVVDIDPNRFKKIEGEREQIADMKKEFRKLQRQKFGSNLTNKQISKIFNHKAVVGS